VRRTLTVSWWTPENSVDIIGLFPVAFSCFACLCEIGWKLLLMLQQNEATTPQQARNPTPSTKQTQRAGSHRPTPFFLAAHRAVLGTSAALCLSLQPPSISMGALEAIKYADGKLQLLDQRLLPLETVYLDVDTPQAAWQQIKVSAGGGTVWPCREHWC
jgi:hypothetical protein